MSDARRPNCHAAVTAPLLPMKAIAGDLPPDDGAWWFEVKWDGMRILAHVEGDAVVLRSARGADATTSFPELRTIAESVGGRSCVLDGEVVAMGDRGAPSFARLQQRMHISDPRLAAERAAEVPVVYMVFDLLELDGRPTTSLTYVERRRLLEDLVGPGPTVQVPAAFPSGGADLLEAARRQGLEGVVAKRVDSAYQPGGRSDRWRKVKVRHEQEFVVAGWLGGTGVRAHTIGSLVLGCRRDGELAWVGNVGTGFTDRELRRLAALLGPLAVDACPFPTRPEGPTGSRARWVAPELVVQVAFGEWTEAGRLRHPAYLGQRDDKDAAEVTCDP